MFRQGVIDTTRALVASPELSYSLHVSDNRDLVQPALKLANQVQTARNLLSNDAYTLVKPQR